MTDAKEWKVDKSEWGEGPWMEEPDREEWRAHGLPCLIVREAVNGHLCGYVALPPGHPWGEYRDKEQIPAAPHGGVTYLRPNDPDGPVHLTPELGESTDVLWVGFDCMHPLDYAPFYSALEKHYAIFTSFRDLATYRDIHYVRGEVEELAKQAADASERAHGKQQP